MKKYYVHQLRVEGSAYFGPSYPIAVCDNKENAQRIADSLNNDRNENVLFAYSVFEVETESVSDDILEKNAMINYATSEELSGSNSISLPREI